MTDLVHEDKNIGDATVDRETEQDALRALDKEVAERVMGQVACDGWAYMNFGSAGGPALQKTCGHKSTECYPNKQIAAAFGSYDGVPPYSRKIDAAFKVVGKMRSDHWSFASTMYENELPYASFCRGTATSSKNAEAPTLPEAICRAALKATECLSDSALGTNGQAS